jgi:7-cyano-7-deazaguanine synthase in queuosine biosynthesis
MDKSQTIKQYYDLGIERYLPLTHSCGNDTDEPCKKCFNCVERKWAYDTLGLEVDYGS